MSHPLVRELPLPRSYHQVGVTPWHALCQNSGRRVWKVGGKIRWEGEDGVGRKGQVKNGGNRGEEQTDLFIRDEIRQIKAKFRLTLTLLKQGKNTHTHTHTLKGILLSEKLTFPSVWLDTACYFFKSTHLLKVGLCKPMLCKQILVLLKSSISTFGQYSPI